MIQIKILNLEGKTIYSNSKTEKLLNVLHENYIDWMHACGKKGRCTTCKAIIISGKENLAELTASEKRFRSNHKLAPGERLCCQAEISGPVEIKVPDIYKLPHLTYSD